MTSTTAADGHGHSVRRGFEEALQAAKDETLRLGDLVESQLERAGHALRERDVELADSVRWDDAQVNELQRSINM